MERAIKIVTLFLAGMGLTGCGGGLAGTYLTTGLTAQGTPDAYFTRVVQPGYSQYASDIAGNTFTGTTGLPNTAFAGMPTSGTATYNGYALLGVNLQGTQTNLPKIGVEGTATLTADFSNNGMSGVATNFVGGAVGAQNTATGQYPLVAPAAYYAGTIAITNGCIGTAAACPNVTRANQYSANFAGTLTGQGNTIVSNGALLGDFRGTPIAGVTGIGQSGTLTVNGVAATGTGQFSLFVKP